jgi:hypothetical protein
VTLQKLGRNGNIIFYLKFPRQCPLVLLKEVRLEFRVKLTFFYFFYFKVIEVGGAALGRNLG